MTNPAELYQRLVVDHNRAPRNYRVPDPCSHHARGHNPLCGDQVTLYLDIRDDVIRDIGFQGDACAIATASASMLTEALQGLALEDALELARCFEDALDAPAPPTHSRSHGLQAQGLQAAAVKVAVAGSVDGGPGGDGADTPELGDLRVLLVVRNYPGREQCARLPWQALRDALNLKAI